MLKVRLMGTKRDMKWFRKNLERDRRIHIIRISEPYAIKGSDRFYRMYIEAMEQSLLPISCLISMALPKSSFALMPWRMHQRSDHQKSEV